MLLLDSAISKKQDLLSKDLGFALLGCRFRGLNDQRDGIPYNPYDFTLPFIPSLSFRLNFICCALRLRLLFLLSPPFSLCWDHRPLKRWSHLYLSCQKLNTAQPCNSLMVFFQFNMQTIFVISLKSLIVCQLNDCISTSSHVSTCTTDCLQSGVFSCDLHKHHLMAQFTSAGVVWTRGERGGGNRDNSQVSGECPQRTF